MFNIPILQPGFNKTNNFLLNLSNLKWFVTNILETIHVIMMNTI